MPYRDKDNPRLRRNAVECTDQSDRCPSWSVAGYCTHSRYEAFMQVNCKKSCNLCPGYCSTTLCKEGEGDCGMDSECEGALVCGHMNCANSTLQQCCTQTCNNDTECQTSGECNAEHNQCRLNSDTVDWSRCSQDVPCSDLEGDCDNDGECEGFLVCGNDKCSSGPSDMDCCIGKLVSSVFSGFGY